MESCKPVELVTMFVEEKSPGPCLVPQILFPTIYGLNKSFSKKIYMGLQVCQEGIVEPEVRIIGADFHGVRLSSFDNFLSTFEVISNFFASGKNDRSMLDQKLIGCGFSIRFIISHKEKAVEIEEDGSGAPPKMKKKYRRSVILKQPTFEMLKEYIPLLQAKIAYYKQLAGSYNLAMQEIVRQGEDNAREKPQQRTDIPLNGDPDFSDEDFQRVLDMLRQNNDILPLSLAELKVIYNEILHLRFNANNFGRSIPDEALI